MADFEIREIDGARVVKLRKPIQGVKGTITAIVLRPPKYSEIMRYGDPDQHLLFKNAMLPYPELSIVQSYIAEICADQDGVKIDPVWLEQCHYRDGLALTEAVLSFFREEKAPTPQPSFPPSSEASDGSSTDAGSPST